MQPVKYWYEVLVLTAEKLYVEGNLKVGHTPIKFFESAHCIHTEPLHPSGAEFTGVKEIGNPPLYVNIHLNAGQIRANARPLLRKYDVGPSGVLLLPGE